MSKNFKNFKIASGKFGYLFGAVILAGVATLLLVPSKAIAASTSMYFASASATSGTDLYVQVRANTGTQTVNAVQADFTYPTSLLTFVAIDHTSSAFDVTASETENLGTISIQRGATSSQSGNLLIATVHFTVASVNIATLAFQNSSVLLNGGNSVALQTSNARFIGLFGPLMPVYRLRNSIKNDRLWTMSSSERNKILSLSGWKNEGIAFYAVSSNSNGALPVYRLRNPIRHDRLWTASATERTNVLKLYGWKSEGIAYYAIPPSINGTVPVYRLRNSIKNDRFWTASATERTNVLKLYGWKSEGIGYYATP